MKKMLNSSLILGVLALATISARAQVDLYVDDANGKIGVVDLDISNPSASTVSYLGQSNPAISDIAFTANGFLYGTSHSGVYSISLSTAAATLLGSYGSVGNYDMVGLVGDGNELLASSYATSKIYAIDVSSFAISTLGGTTGGDSQGDLAFGTGPTSSTLYDTLNNGKLSEITISGSTISSTVIGLPSSQTISGLATDSAGEVFAVSGTEVYVLDTATDSLTPFFNYAGHGLGKDAGAAIVQGGVTVPEPSNVALLVAGVVGLALFQARARARA